MNLDTTLRERFKKALEKRDSRMYGYYKSVFTEDFELGYPAEWDEEYLDDVLSILRD